VANECKGSRPLPWLLLARPTRRPSKNVGLLRSSLHDVRRELNPECFGDRLVENQFLDGDFLERDVAGLFAAQDARDSGNTGSAPMELTGRDGSVERDSERDRPAAVGVPPRHAKHRALGSGQRGMIYAVVSGSAAPPAAV
jgi:hypothetical protein